MSYRVVNANNQSEKKITYDIHEYEQKAQYSVVILLVKFILFYSKQVVFKWWVTA